MYSNKFPFYFSDKKLDLLSVGIYLKIAQSNKKIKLEDLITKNTTHNLEVIQALKTLEDEKMIVKKKEGYYVVSNIFKMLERVY